MNSLSCGSGVGSIHDRVTKYIGNLLSDYIFGQSDAALLPEMAPPTVMLVAEVSKQRFTGQEPS